MEASECLERNVSSKLRIFSDLQFLSFFNYRAIFPVPSDRPGHAFLQIESFRSSSARAEHTTACETFLQLRGDLKHGGRKLSADTNI
jgi:hypothetical protein